jgi:phosphatidylinositol alpha-1,6-mannosyltransferase
VCWLATESDEPPPSGAPQSSAAIATILARIDEAGGYKGHRELIACWPQVAARVPQARLRIAGDGPGREIVRGWVERSSARSSIEMLGFVPEPRVEALLRESSVLAMPSRGEGFGLAYIEAMRVGVPVIASVHDAAPEVVVDGKTGYCVDLDVPGQLTERLCTLLGNLDHARELGRAAQARWADQLRFERFAERFMPALRELLARS